MLSHCLTTSVACERTPWKGRARRPRVVARREAFYSPSRVVQTSQVTHSVRMRRAPSTQDSPDRALRPPSVKPPMRPRGSVAERWKLGISASSRLSSTCRTAPDRDERVRNETRVKRYTVGRPRTGMKPPARELSFREREIFSFPSSPNAPCQLRTVRSRPRANRRQQGRAISTSIERERDATSHHRFTERAIGGQNESPVDPARPSHRSVTDGANAAGASDRRTPNVHRVASQSPFVVAKCIPTHAVTIPLRSIA